MGKNFRDYLRGLQKTANDFIKLLSNRKKLNKFFHSRNAELAIIILLAIAIPMTVLGLQQIQDIRERAATTSPTPGTASSTVDNDPDNPNNNLPACGSAGQENFVVSPSQPVQGSTVTFSLKDGSMLDNELNGFGNGVIANTCVQSGNNITCTARGNFTCPTTKPNCTAKTSGISTHTWFTLKSGGGKIDNCQYKVQKASAPIGGGGGGSIACKGTISPVCDTGNGNKPGLQLQWQMSRSTACKLLVKKTTGSTQQILTVDCGKTASQTKTIYNIGSDPISDNVTYQLVLQSDNTACNNVTKGTAQPQCHPVNQLTPTSTPKAGTGTGTPTPTPTGTRTNQPTPTRPTEPAACTQKDVHLDQRGTSCLNGEIRLTGGWDISGPNCIVTLYENGKAVSDANRCKGGGSDGTKSNETAWETTKIDGRRLIAGAKYVLKAKSNSCTTEMASIEVTATSCAGASPTPTKTPTPTQRTATATPTRASTPAGACNTSRINGQELCYRDDKLVDCTSCTLAP